MAPQYGPRVELISNNSIRPTPALESGQSLEKIALERGFTREQALAVLGVTNWSNFLKGDEGGETNTYLSENGFTKDKRLLYNAKRGHSIDDDTVSNIIESFGSGELNPEIFCNSDISELQNAFPELTKSKLQLLQRFINREVLLDSTEIDDLSAQFPFPITESNFFGRFINGVAKTPQAAVRYLKSSTPFFIQMRSLIEGLQNDEKNFLMIPSLSLKDPTIQAYRAEEDLSDVEKEQRRLMSEMEVEIKEELFSMLKTCIEGANDLMDTPENQKMKCVSIPALPNLMSQDIEHIERTEIKKLAAEIMEWIILGIEDGELINRKALSIHDIKLSKKLANEIPVLVKKLKTLEIELTKAYEKYKKDESLQNKNRCYALEEEKKELRETITFKNALARDLKKEKKMVKPIIGKLNERSEGYKAGITKFRKEIIEAQESGDKLVFSSFDGWGDSVFTEYFDRAFAQCRHKKSELMEILKNCSFVTSREYANKMTSSATNGASITNTRLRDFELGDNLLSQSTSYILEEISYQKEDGYTRELQDYIIRNIKISGVSIRSQLKYLTGKLCGKNNPNIADYLEYVFEHTSHISKEQILGLLDILIQLRVTKIPERCRQIAIERFHLPIDIFNQFGVYSSNYHPDKLGSLPYQFQDDAKLGDYLGMKLESYGMKDEVEALEKYLVDGKGVVGIIDTTEYHPEFVKSDIAGAKEKDDTEDSGEIWGDYTRPSERLARSLAYRIMEGTVRDELKDHSLVSMTKPSEKDKVNKALYKMMLGINLNITQDLSNISQLLSDLHNYDQNTILVINAENVKNLEQYKQLVELLEKFRFKVVLRLREGLPGLPQVTLSPFMDNEIADRIYAQEPSLRAKMGLQEPIEHGIIEFAAKQVRKMRQPSDDPLNLTLQVINGAAQNARMNNFQDLQEQDITVALSQVFHLPDTAQMKTRLAAIENFFKVAPIEVLGQKEPIEKIGKRVESHLLGLRDPSRPLTLLLPGPTGVGKTELMMKLAQLLNIPFFHIEGAEFSEAHTVARLVGSPSGYQGPDKGILYEFIESNSVGIVFIDEIEKMHSAVNTALMNFYDKATLTAGDGSTATRPGLIIAGASNAGADQLKKYMSEREVKDILSSAFVGRDGVAKPELVRRFEAITMLPIDEDEFMKVIHLNLDSIGGRFGLINSNLRLNRVDDSAVRILYESSKEVCAYEQRTQSIGFGTGKITNSGGFFDMRHISRALDSLLGDSMIDIVKEQINSDNALSRGNAAQVELVGNDDGKGITMKYVEKNTSNS